MENIDTKLLSISSKLQTAKNNHDDIMAERRAETSKENNNLIQKVQRYKNDQEIHVNSVYNKFQQDEQAKDKRLRQTYNSMHKGWMNFKDKRREQFEYMSNRKADNDEDVKQKHRDLKDKMDRSAKVVEQYMADLSHKNMLTQELTKLKDEDIRKIHARAKRLEDKKKKEIMTNEEKNLVRITNQKNKEQKLIDFRYQNKVRFNVDKHYFNQTMENWAHSGFSAKSNRMGQDKDFQGMQQSVESKIDITKNNSPRRAQSINHSRAFRDRYSKTQLLNA